MENIGHIMSWLKFLTNMVCPQKNLLELLELLNQNQLKKKMKIVYLLIIHIKCKGQMFTEKENKVQLT